MVGQHWDAESKSVVKVGGRRNGKRYRRRIVAYTSVLSSHFVTWGQRIVEGQDMPVSEWSCSCGQKFGFSDTWISHCAEELAKLDLG